MGKNTLPKNNDPVNETSIFEDGWKMSFLLGQKAYFQGRLPVSLPECKFFE